jgi:hypothetical protein
VTDKSLDELTRAYLAVEGILHSRIISDRTKNQLLILFAELERDILTGKKGRMNAPQPPVTFRTAVETPTPETERQNGRKTDPGTQLSG